MKLFSFPKWAAGVTLALFLASMGSTAALAAKKPAKKRTAKPAPAAVKTIPVKIAMVGSLSGTYAADGKAMKQGFTLALEQAKNKAGNCTVQTVMVDDQSDANEGYEKTRKLLLKDKIAVIVGPLSSAIAERVSELANAKNVPCVLPIASADFLTMPEGQRAPYTFRAVVADSLQGKMGAGFALNYLKGKRVGILQNADESYSVDVADAFRETAEQKGVIIAADYEYYEGTEDFSEALKSIAQADLDVLYLPGFDYHVSMIAAQIKQAKLDCKLLCSDAALYSDADYAALEGAYVTDYYANDDPRPAMKNFLQQYQSRFGERANESAVFGYEATMLALNAIKNANSADPEKVRAALQNTRNLPMVTGQTTIDGQGSAVKPCVVKLFNAARDTEYVTAIDPVTLMPIYTASTNRQSPKTESASKLGASLQPVTVDGIELVPYKNEDAGFAMLVPKGWPPIGEGDSGAGWTANSSDKVFLSIATSEKLYQVMEDKGVVAGFKAILKLAVLKLENCTATEPKPIMVSGLPGAEASFTNTDRGTEFVTVERVFLNSGLCWDAAFKIETGKRNKYENALKKCLDSLEISGLPSGSQV
ncbi:MAG: ABC transporter substrate-binding protein [Solirubrobacterales bacterium]